MLGKRLGLGLLLLALPVAAADAARQLPEFEAPGPSLWLNTEPLTVDALRGKVVLVEFWTFGCGNCVRSIPWVERLDERYGERGLVVVGVHTPEFDHERKIDNVRRFIADQGITHPVLIDNGLRYWKKLNNRYWPTFYLVDREGKIRNVHVGETHDGTERAAAVERKIEALLSE